MIVFDELHALAASAEAAASAAPAPKDDAVPVLFYCPTCVVRFADEGATDETRGVTHRCGAYSPRAHYPGCGCTERKVHTAPMEGA